MWSNFFEAGGWGMYPTMLFGFLFLAVTALHALRRDARHQRVSIALGTVTFASGLLGTVVGICNSVHYLAKVPREDQFLMFAMGCEESLHNLVLALILVVIGGLISAGSALRREA